ncbi:MAG TPA: LON peptidase substrate-binding domain-containing protein [Candidatus Methylacidiphilales bacterium]|jgi:Lon protease-like protein|nr:LON peptidase substrate-binding domain-containing protein [Candidatus Methylacidiphilales bacterium]
MELPEEVGIMTLPNAILFPQALLPLYIFEPRYRTMLKQSLESQRMFAVALPRTPTSSPNLVPNRIAGVGLIRACVDKPDGSSNLILQGVSRVRFTDFVQEKPFYIGRIEVLDTEESDALEVEALSVKVLEMIGTMHDAGQIQAEGILKFLREIQDYDALADIVTYSFIEDLPSKQQILETLNLRDRLKKVIVALRKQSAGPKLG